MPISQSLVISSQGFISSNTKNFFFCGNWAKFAKMSKYFLAFLIFAFLAVALTAPEERNYEENFCQ